MADIKVALKTPPFTYQPGPIKAYHESGMTSKAWAAYQRAGAKREEPTLEEQLQAPIVQETAEKYGLEPISALQEVKRTVELATATTKSGLPVGITESQAKITAEYLEQTGQLGEAEIFRERYARTGHPGGFVERAVEVGYGPFVALEDYKVGDSYNLAAAFEAGVVTPEGVRDYFPEADVSQAVLYASILPSLRLGGFITLDGGINLAGALAAGAITEAQARQIFSGKDVDAAVEARGIVGEERLDYRGLFPYGIGAEVEVEPRGPTAWEKFVAFFREPRPDVLISPGAGRITPMDPELQVRAAELSLQPPPGYIYTRPWEEQFPIISGPLLTTTRYWEQLSPPQRALGIGTVALQIAGFTSPIWAPRVPLPGPLRSFFGVPRKVPTVEYGLVGKAGFPVTPAGRMVTGGPTVRFPVGYKGGVRLPTSQIYQTIPVTHFPSAYGEIPGFGVHFMGPSVPMQAPISLPGGVSGPIPWALKVVPSARPYWHPWAPGLGFVGPSGGIVAPPFPLVGTPSVTIPTTATMTPEAVAHQLAALGGTVPIISPGPLRVTEVSPGPIPETRVTPSIVPGISPVPYPGGVPIGYPSIVPSPMFYPSPGPVTPTPGITPVVPPIIIPGPTLTVTPTEPAPPQKPPLPPLLLPGGVGWGWRPFTRRPLKKLLGVGIWKFAGFPVAAPHPLLQEVVGYRWMKEFKKPYGVRRSKVKKLGGGLVRMTA